MHVEKCVRLDITTHYLKCTTVKAITTALFVFNVTFMRTQAISWSERLYDIVCGTGVKGFALYYEDH